MVQYGCSGEIFPLYLWPIGPKKPAADTAGTGKKPSLHGKNKNFTNKNRMIAIYTMRIHPNTVRYYAKNKYGVNSGFLLPLALYFSIGAY